MYVQHKLFDVLKIIFIADCSFEFDASIFTFGFKILVAKMLFFFLCTTEQTLYTALTLSLVKVRAKGYSINTVYY
jgi:hypothetical protein